MVAVMRTFFSLIIGCLAILLCSSAAFANPFEDAIRILENRTAFHWGRDCFVWMVHYSESLVDPWVASEAGRTGMTDSEQKAYRDGVISDLSIGETEPVLVTVHAFGARPLDFSPFSEKIALITPDGERVKPTKHDSVLDQPMSGVVQGLVFFPKQSDPDFAVAISGLGVYDERIFSFDGERPALGNAQTIEAPKEDEVVVVELPPAPAKPAAPRTQPRREPRAARASAPPPEPEPAPAPEPARPPEPEAPEPEIVVLEPEAPAEDDSQDVAYSSREQALRTFLDLWVKFDSETMYSMLSDSSRKLFTKETFEAELKKASDFRNALRGGYNIDWLGAERGKVVAVRRILLIRTLLSRTLGVTREDAAWKIVW
jgi:hypothetical protein